ncbi:C40 family peptidase [Paenibacillus nasutitermitis]|uniref:NlpC/P60 domain-containing protein n=1 Tax=Paenibacillus nasutitermitis TaxID=1652958 RepID=A0A916ZL50_9BACL|nr:C40 family peptidase [Paenibacillus nasutitermitis]GGE01520.1 hypothetical protein GCM10010911_70530 [Paenibacillus nasutitermitis]
MNSKQTSWVGKIMLSAILMLLIVLNPLISKPDQVSAASSGGVEKAIKIGLSYLGTPYQFGSDRSNTRTFDCSDLVHYMFEKGAGISLPSTSATQGNYVKTHSAITGNWHNLKRGDLMFFRSYNGSSESDYTGAKSQQTITHVAIYLGEGRMLQTYSQASGGVRTDDIAGTSWEYRFLFGGSVK